MRKLYCAKCKVSIPPAILQSDAPYVCHSCGTLQYTEVFPAFFEEVEKGEAPELAIMEEDARCFNHSDKIAVVPCAECGIFLCALCDINADGVHLCSKCFKANKDKLKNFATKTIVYDKVLLAIALVPMLFAAITIITAPAVLVCAFLFRKKLDNTPYIRSHWKYHTAIIIALLQIVGWIVLIISIARKA